MWCVAHEGLADLPRFTADWKPPAPKYEMSPVSSITCVMTGILGSCSYWRKLLADKMMKAIPMGMNETS